MAWFAKHAEPAELRVGSVFHDGVDYGLYNLAQRCRPLPADEWQLCIDDHFAKILAATDERREWRELESDFGSAAPLLRLRLQSPDMRRPGDCLAREELPGTVSHVVADMPSSLLGILDDVLERWQRSAEEVFALARAQTVRDCPIEWEEVSLGPAPSPCLFVASADHFFVCTHVFRLDAWPRLTAADGCLVAIPDRQTMLVLPLVAGGLSEAVESLVSLAHRRHEQGPGSVSPHLYWRRADGGFEVQLCEMQDGSLQVTPSRAFADVLDRLTRAG